MKWISKKCKLFCFRGSEQANGGKYDDKGWVKQWDREKKCNFIRYVIKVINQSWHCNDIKWTEKMLICSDTNKMAEKTHSSTQNKVTFVYCSLSCKQNTNIYISATSNKQRITVCPHDYPLAALHIAISLYLYLYLYLAFYCMWNKFIALSDIESCLKLNSIFCVCVAIAVVWECVASTDMIIIDISNNKQRGIRQERWTHFCNIFFLYSTDSERDKIHSNSEKLGQHSENFQEFRSCSWFFNKICYKLIFHRVIIDFV